MSTIRRINPATRRSITGPVGVRRTARPSPYPVCAALAWGVLGPALAATQPQPGAPAAQPPAAPGEAARTFTQQIRGTTVSIPMVSIPGGTARDGTTIKPFSMSATEITWDVYDVWVFSLDVPEGAADATTRPTKPYLLMDRGFGHAGYPAISMSAKGAEEFCAWLSAKTGRKYRLPTEAEWEHACLAGSRDGPAEPLDEVAWYEADSDAKTHTVGTKKPNRWGLFDMLGNASEWVTGPDGKALTAGGCFRDAAENVKPSSRVEPSRAWNASDPQIPKSVWWLADGGFVGFRVVCEEPDKK